MDTKNLVIAAVIGIAAGWLASIVMGGSGLLRYLTTGVIGSFVGSYVLNKAGINLGVSNEYVRDIITATIGAIIVVFVARFLA
jgi:uncharacterized membrane protein YeaQ/YmgE (transglycosylase-associated protein family)